MASSPIVSGNEVRYLFIDGGCLRAALQDIANRYANGHELTLDFEGFTQQYSKVFYYDAMPARLEDEDDEAYAKRNEKQI